MFPHNNEGRNQLLKDYDQEELAGIASHGCELGVCHKHIYYVDTIAFFDKHEAEILDLIHVRYGVDELVSIFTRSEADYDMYRNECCWLFIENVATDVVIDNEESQLAEDQLVEEYMKPVDNYVDDLFNGKLQQSAEDLMNLSAVTNVIKDGNNLKLEGINPPQSMTDSRYSQI